MTQFFNMTKVFPLGRELKTYDRVSHPVTRLITGVVVKVTDVSVTVQWNDMLSPILYLDGEIKLMDGLVQELKRKIYRKKITKIEYRKQRTINNKWLGEYNHRTVAIIQESVTTRDGVKQVKFMRTENVGLVAGDNTVVVAHIKSLKIDFMRRYQAMMVPKAEEVTT